MRLENAHHDVTSLLHDSDLPGLEDAAWMTKDSGNGEQTAWWCWAMARLRRQMGMPAEPAKPATLTN